MSETATVARPQQVRKFGQSSVQPLGHDIEIMSAVVPTGWTFSDVLKPIAWNFVAHNFASDPISQRRDKIGCLILAADPNYVAWLRVRGVTRDEMKNPSGLDVVCIGPSFNPVTGKACPVDNNGEAWTR